MLFNSPIFLFAFLPITYLMFWSLGSARSRYIWLTLSGYVFYGYWNPKYCLLMLFSTAVSYFCGIAMLRLSDSLDDRQRRKMLLITAVSVDLLLLGIFKYSGFAAQTLNGAFKFANADILLPVLDVTLPVGISFYTFHTISYMVDSYRGVVTPTRNFFEFSAYVSLFSQLVAGPIVRFRQIEKDLENIASAQRTKGLSIGISFFVFGLVEKVLVADSIAHFVDPAFANPGKLTMIAAWFTVAGYSMQLYFDFCGYSTMAVGLGLMFGLTIPINFNSPYKALNPSDFWQRWHISLSTCMRDYLYIPMGGNRNGEAATYRNLILTMLIGGLWHGAAWTFVLWGFYHGCLLIAYRSKAPYWDALHPSVQRWSMVLLIALGWVLFRSSSFTAAAEMFAAMGSGAMSFEGVSPVLAAMVVLSLTWAAYGPNAYDFHYKYRPSWTIAFRNAIVFGACLAIIVGSRNSPFLYFQF